MSNISELVPAGEARSRGDAETASRIIEIVTPHSTLVTGRRRQRISVESGREDRVYVVRSGLLALHATLSDDRRLIVELLYPGDIYRSFSTLSLPDPVLVAVNSCDVLRMRGAAFDELLRVGHEPARLLGDCLTRQHARLALRVATIGLLSGEERVAAFLVELGWRLGMTTPAGVLFEVPLARPEVAAYLALNPDTLSRHMSRLRDRGLVEQRGRGRILVRDIEALKRECRIAEEIERLLAGH